MRKQKEDTRNEKGRRQQKRGHRGRWSHSLAGRNPKMSSSKGNWRGKEEFCRGTQSQWHSLAPFDKVERNSLSVICVLLNPGSPTTFSEGYRKSRRSCCSHRATLGTVPAPVTYQEAALAANRSTPNVTWGKLNAFVLPFEFLFERAYRLFIVHKINLRLF